MLLMLQKYYIDPCQTNFHLLISIPPYNNTKYHYQESDGSTRKNGWRKIEVVCGYDFCLASVTNSTFISDDDI